MEITGGEGRHEGRNILHVTYLAHCVLIHSSKNEHALCACTSYMSRKLNNVSILGPSSKIGFHTESHPSYEEAQDNTA